MKIGKRGGKEEGVRGSGMSQSLPTIACELCQWPVYMLSLQRVAYTVSLSSDMAAHLIESTGDILDGRMDECCHILHSSGENPDKRRSDCCVVYYSILDSGYIVVKL